MSEDLRREMDLVCEVCFTLLGTTRGDNLRQSPKVACQKCAEGRARNRDKVIVASMPQGSELEGMIAGLKWQVFTIDQGRLVAAFRDERWAMKFAEQSKHLKYHHASAQHSDGGVG